MAAAPSSSREPARDPQCALAELARDVRWTWSHEADALWNAIDPAVWQATRNPWIVLQSAPRSRLSALVTEEPFRALLTRAAAARDHYLAGSAQRRTEAIAGGIPKTAYFSMEFGVGEALPLYAGGLGILAGDVLKTASDLGLPLVGIGLLYQSGYFRQLVDARGWQQESFPYNEPASLPIAPVLEDGAPVSLVIDFPGRQLRLRVWRARVGIVDLFLLDSNDPLNTPVDRGITGQLYGGGSEMRLAQEVVLGVGGWRLVERLGLGVEICHINEGHAAFAVLERARHFMEKAGCSFDEAFWTTRAGNVFTTHTPVDAGFDRYSPELIQQYLPYAESFLTQTGLSLDDALALGRADPGDPHEPFNMAFLAMRGALVTFGVSQLHGKISRRIFGPLFPRRPEAEVPVGHITNGVHVPTWESRPADEFWTKACGERWRCAPPAVGGVIAALGDEQLWGLRAVQRANLVQYARGRLARQLGARASAPAMIAAAGTVLDPNVLTLGFARRFTAYKRPNLLLREPERLVRLLADAQHPVQLVIAGKAHPHDVEGKALIREWVAFTERPDMRHRVVFLEDYDIALAQPLVQGVDVWINTPRRPLEACGTSGMKVLVNGGLKLSVRDGWWAEAFRPELGWAIGSDAEAIDGDADRTDASTLYDVLEREVVPEFYTRDRAGIPRRWVERVRRSMAELTTTYSSHRMMVDYVERAYRPAAQHLRDRVPNAAATRELAAWARRLLQHWGELHIDEPRAMRDGDAWSFVVPVLLGELAPNEVRVELFAAPPDGAEDPTVIPLDPGESIAGTTNGFLYAGRAPRSRPSVHYTARVVPAHPRALLPLEMPLVRWQR